MIRRIIKIDEEKCNGCGICTKACHEKAISIIDGKARLLRDDYCDGLGDCLPVCPTNAISFEEREALEYNEIAVKENIKKTSAIKNTEIDSQLKQWPVQIKLVPSKAHYFENASLLIAADCTAFSYGNFHQDFIQDNVTLIGCPKLDMEDYSNKLGEIIKNNDIKTIKVARMEVPCCSGIEYAVKAAIKNSNKDIDYKVIIISIKGKIVK